MKRCLVGGRMQGMLLLAAWGWCAGAESIREPLQGVVDGLEAGRTTAVYHEFGEKLAYLLQPLDMACRKTAAERMLNAPAGIRTDRDFLAGPLPASHPLPRGWTVSAHGDISRRFDDDFLPPVQETPAP